MNLADAPDALTVEQMRTVLGCSRGLAYELVRQGHIRSVRLGGRSIRIPKAGLLEFLNGPGPADEGPQKNGAAGTTPQGKEVSSTHGHRT
jgi:excisionase family DNA binding protein